MRALEIQLQLLFLQCPLPLGRQCAQRRLAGPYAIGTQGHGGALTGIKARLQVNPLKPIVSLGNLLPRESQLPLGSCQRPGDVDAPIDAALKVRP